MTRRFFEVGLLTLFLIFGLGGVLQMVFRLQVEFLLVRHPNFTGAWLAWISCGAVAVCLLGALRPFLGGVLRAWLLDRPEWLALLRACAFLGLVIVAVSLWALRGSSGAFAFWCYLQLALTVAWALLMLKLAAGAGWPQLASAPVEGRDARILRLLLDIALGAAFGGWILYALALSNVPYFLLKIRPDQAPLFYEWGCRFGVWIALAITPAARGVRLPILTALGVDLLLPFWLSYWAVLPLQLAVAALSMVAEGRTGPLQDAWRFSLGLAAGRVAGRVLGFFFLGLEGIFILEAIGEGVAGTMAVRPPEEGESSASTCASAG